MQQSWSSKEMVFPGIWVYRDVIKPEMNIISRLENAISDSNGKYNWEEATVGYKEKIPDYRDCVDFKIRKDLYGNQDKSQQEFNKIWQEVYDAKLSALNDYSMMYNVKLDYWEAMNFIKYGPGQHFSYHSDHGWSYISTTSLVAYPNDDYEDGGLRFDKIDVEVKPKAGDLYIFPSNYLFSHAALPVTKGLKYSIVTMTDYNDAAHSQSFYEQFKTERSIG